MDLSTAVSGMSGGAASAAGTPASSPISGAAAGGGGGGGAVACPVCTLYLREGISLQKHLDTHPKEQVIEALIRASAGGGAAALLASQACAPSPQPAAVQVPTTQPPMPPVTATAQQPPPASPTPHVPHAQSPYPIGPIFECPPQINAMLPPPQFASFSYQQFVNNGTMMIPAQYAMAQAQAPPSNQMMQMLYSPYGMYHQQQIPTVQMISAPPPPPQAMMPSTTAPLPVASTVAAATTRMRPAVVAVTTSAASHAVTATVNDPATSTLTTTASPPRPTMCAPEPLPHVQQATAPPQVQSQQQHQQEPTVVDQCKDRELIVDEKMIPAPDSILPDLEMPESPESVQVEQEEERSRSHAEHLEQTQNARVQEEQSHVVEQYHREDQPTLISNSCNDVTDDDKTESILPDIEDNDEIESLIVRKPNSRSESHENSDRMEVTESVQSREMLISNDMMEKEFVENIQCNEVHNCKELDDKSNDVQIINEKVEPQNMSVDESRVSTIDKPEFEQMNRLLNNMESELSNIDLSNKESEDINNSKCNEAEQNAMSVSDPLEKQADEDETTNTSYHKTILEPIECKIIVAHEDTDVSSVASSEDGLINYDMEIQKIMSTSKSFYQYKYSQSVPNSPVSKKKFYRSLSRASLPSDFDRSNENVCSYPVGFEATTLHDFLKDNYNDEDMELEDPQPHHSHLKQNNSVIQRTILHTDDVCMMKSRRSDGAVSPVSVRSSSSYCQIEEEEEDEEEEDSDDADSCASGQSNDKDEDDEDEDEDEDHMILGEGSQRTLGHEHSDNKKEMAHTDICKAVTATDIAQQQHSDFRSQSLMTEHYSSSQFPTLSHHSGHQQSQSIPVLHHDTYPISNSGTSQNLLNMTECIDPTTSTDSKSYNSSSPKSSIVPKPSSTELLNISEDAHAGPMNVFEFDGLQILVPSTFISESSQKAVSATSQQSMSSSENGAGNDEEVKSVNMRADETMPARGELSEQESNGCTEQSAWQLYMGQESSRMSTSYDLMARESWEESEGSEHEDNNSGPLLDSRSLATHFTSSLFLDRDRKTPTRRIFKCSHCPEVFECPKERRVHSTMVHKEAGPSSCSNDNIDQPELKEIKLLEGRANVFEDIFAPGGLHLAQQAYQAQHLQQQQPLLHQLQPPQQHQGSAKADADVKLTDGLHLATAAEVTCSLCNQRFSSEKSLQIHHRRMHIAEPVKRVRENAKCQICNEEFTSVANFNLHLKIHPLECGQCGKYFYRKQNFKLHMKRHLGIKPFSCNHCNKAFLTKQKLDEHTNGHTGNAPVKCNLCNETFRRYSNLTQHKNRHHLNIKKKLKDYICHCGEVFHTKKKLAWHKETHDEKPKACTYCNERFIHMASLTRHMRRAHNRRFVPDAQRESENVECPICKCIYLRSSLAVHMRVHNGERPYECQVCSKTFSTKWNLQLHKWTHAARSTKPFKCNQCSAAFYRHSDYTAHMNSHRNVRPYTCNYCGAQFIRKYNCLRHVKEHEENKAYTCEICNKTFHRSYYLKEHLRVHSGARPYACHICGKCSSTKSNHNKHVRIHHAREPVNTEN